MDPLAARLSKLSVSRSGKQENRKGKKQGKGKGRQVPASGLNSPVSGLRTPASGLQTPLSGIRTPASAKASQSHGRGSPYVESESDLDDEDDEEEEEVRKPFNFFGLPYELRHKVLRLVMRFNDTLDLNVNATWRIRMMPVSRQFYHECCEAFYGGNMFRLLPLDGPVHKKRTRPLIQFFSARNRAYITRLELRLGPHWKDPPRCWQIGDELGVEDLKSLRRLDIIVQVDPEHPSFAGFRRSKEFYTEFSGDLLDEIIRRAPAMETVHIDSYPAVGRDSPLLRRLETEALAADLNIIWSPHLKLDDCYDVVMHPAEGVSVYDTVVVREMIMTDF